MKKNIFIVLALTAALFILAPELNLGFCMGSAPAKAVEAQAPDFTLPDLEGKEITLSSFKEKNSVILFFWTTWCPYCRRDLKTLQADYAQMSAQGVKLLTVDIAETKAKVQMFARENLLTLPVLLDADMAVAQKYQVFGVPTFVGIGKDGAIKFNRNFLPEDFAEVLK